MSGAACDSKASLGLANSLSNVFKLADVNGLRWVRYTGPNSPSLEAPKDDPVLNTYAKLLNDGYACSWRRLSPSVDGQSGEAKDLWVFYFTDLPDISDKLAETLQEEGNGSWEDGMTPESSTMLYRALHNLIERSLLNENFLPLGKWFARPDSSLSTDGSSRGCFLCSFSFFVHAHLYICASVDMRAGPALQPLLPSHVNQALASSTGLQVILSPSGLNATMTGHSYKSSDMGIDEILEEWRLFYPRRFALNPSPGLPAAIEVILGGVRMRYPSQFVFVYHGEETLPTPPPSPVEERSMEELIQDTWEGTSCADIVTQQRNSVQCRCEETVSNRRSHSHRRQSASLDPPLKAAEHLKQSRYEPYPSPSSSSFSSRKKGLSTPGSLSLMNIQALNTKKKLNRLGLPKYTTPLSSPAFPPPPPSVSPTPQKPSSQALPTISLSAAAAVATAGIGTQSDTTILDKFYDPSGIASLTKPSTHTPASAQYNTTTHGWWDCISLPESLQALGKLQLPRLEKDTMLMSRYANREGMSSPSLSSPGLIGSPSQSALGALLSPTSKKGLSPGRGRGTMDHLPTSLPAPGKPTSSPGERPGTPKRRGSFTKPSLVAKGRGKVVKGGDGRLGIGSLSPILAQEDGFEGAMVSPMSVGGDHPHPMIQNDALEGFGLMGGSEGSSLEMRGAVEKSSIKPQYDVFSDKAVKITDLDQIFDSDEEEDTPQAMDPTPFSFGQVLDHGRGDEKMDTSSSKTTKMAASDPITLSDLSRIYPTPPSVECAEEKFDEGRFTGEDRGEHHISPWDYNNSCLDEELVCVPLQFTPLTGLPSFRLRLPKQCVYTLPSPNSAHERKSDSEVSKTAITNMAEPQKFIFPPPSTLASRAQKIESLTLPLSARKHISPHHIFTPQLLSSSPAFPSKRPSRFYLSTSATPLDSPFDNVTPTPLSATMNRLMPVLPEAHGLYINLALLDSALGVNLSETLSINTGNIMLTIQNFMNFSSKRLKLDSVSSTSAAVERSSSTTELLSYQDEKPVMTFGIADYPSLGFREELGKMMGATTPTNTGNWAAPYGVLSRVMAVMGREQSAPSDSDADAQLLVKFLELLQDYCLHLCLSSCPDTQDGLREKNRQNHLMGRPNRSDQGGSTSSSRLYHSHSVVSALLSAKQLVVGAGKKQATPISSKPSPVTLAKEDNSASWILELMTLPTKFIAKRLRELRSVFQYSFHHAPCLKFSTRGPLTLKDLQQLTPSQTALGDECSPLPMQPVVVGYDHEWLSVSPLTLPAWEKLLFEPYAMRKMVTYLVVAPDTPSLSPILRKFFRDLSIMFKNCHLGQHVPLEKGIGDEGIVSTCPFPSSPSSPSTSTPTKDPLTNTRHGSPAALADLNKLCKNILAPYLSSLPTDHDLLCTHTSLLDPPPSSSINQPPSPLSIVLYVVCSGGRSSKDTFRTLHTFSELVSTEKIPAATRERIVVQLLDSRELFGPNSGHGSQLKSLAFSVYSRCRPSINIVEGARTLTSFGPAADKMKLGEGIPRIRVHAPPYILSPESPLMAMGPLIGTKTHHILFNPKEAVLFCGYCVSPDQRWLLVVCCDRQGELLDSSIIGIQPEERSIDGSRYAALQKLWTYLVSLVSGSLFKWNIVITRFGKPSNSEIRDWPNILVDDGLLTTNQTMRNKCNTCTLTSLTSSRPHITNVLMVSVQPERNIQLFPTHDPNPSISHVMVLPQDPRAAATAPVMTPSATDTGDVFEINFGEASTGGDMAFPMDAGFLGDIGSELSNMPLDWGEGPQGGVTQVEDTSPKATGYLISTSLPGPLPDEFWGHSVPQTLCSMFKVLLHCHRSEKAFADDPQQTLGSTLLCFDALSWLTMDHVTRQRRSCLPIHLFILSKMYHLFKSLEQCR